MTTAPSAAPSAVEAVVDDLATVTLTAGPYSAVFLPTLGMVGASLTYAGGEHLHFAGPDACRAGHTTGLPLLHPWANRLSRPTYEASGQWVDVAPTSPVHLLDGLPIHGTMVTASAWQVEAVLADSTRALLQARYDFGGDPARLASFPFPHDVVVFVELSDLGLRVTTEVTNRGQRDLPVSFGWHPYFELPGVPRRELAVVLPDRERLGLDGRGLPTGEVRQEPAAVVVLGDGSRERIFDDCYRLFDGPGDRVLALEHATSPRAPRRRLEVELSDPYRYAQVYAPSDERFVALEPMTAPVDALVAGDHGVVPPGERLSATFVVRVFDLGPEPDDPDA